MLGLDLGYSGMGRWGRERRRGATRLEEEMGHREQERAYARRAEEEDMGWLGSGEARPNGWSRPTQGKKKKRWANGLLG